MDLKGGAPVSGLKPAPPLPPKPAPERAAPPLPTAEDDPEHGAAASRRTKSPPRGRVRVPVGGGRTPPRPATPNPANPPEPAGKRDERRSPENTRRRGAERAVGSAKPADAVREHRAERTPRAGASRSTREFTGEDRGRIHPESRTDRGEKILRRSARRRRDGGAERPASVIGGGGFLRRDDTRTFLFGAAIRRRRAVHVRVRAGRRPSTGRRRPRPRRKTVAPPFARPRPRASRGRRRSPPPRRARSGGDQETRHETRVLRATDRGGGETEPAYAEPVLPKPVTRSTPSKGPGMPVSTKPRYPDVTAETLTASVSGDDQGAPRGHGDVVDVEHVRGGVGGLRKHLHRAPEERSGRPASGGRPATAALDDGAREAFEMRTRRSHQPERRRGRHEIPRDILSSSRAEDRKENVFSAAAEKREHNQTLRTRARGRAARNASRKRTRIVRRSARARPATRAATAEGSRGEDGEGTHRPKTPRGGERSVSRHPQSSRRCLRRNASTQRVVAQVPPRGGARHAGGGGSAERAPASTSRRAPRLDNPRSADAALSVVPAAPRSSSPHAAAPARRPPRSRSRAAKRAARGARRDRRRRRRRRPRGRRRPSRTRRRPRRRRRRRRIGRRPVL